MKRTLDVMVVPVGREPEFKTCVLSTAFEQNAHLFLSASRT